MTAAFFGKTQHLMVGHACRHINSYKRLCCVQNCCQFLQIILAGVDACAAPSGNDGFDFRFSHACFVFEISTQM